MVTVAVVSLLRRPADRALQFEELALRGAGGVRGFLCRSLCPGRRSLCLGERPPGLLERVLRFAHFVFDVVQQSDLSMGILRVYREQRHNEPPTPPGPIVRTSPENAEMQAQRLSIRPER